MTTEAAPTHYSTRERVVLQFLESTGRHLLDSGDHYGRGWERSQMHAEAVLGPDADLTSLAPGSPELAKLVEAYESGPAATADWEDLTMTTDLYHWMIGRFEYDYRLQAWFDQFVAEQDEEEDLGAWAAYASAFPRWLEKHAYDPETYELVSEKEQAPDSVPIVLEPVFGGCSGGEVYQEYTYNVDNWLSRDILITAFAFDNATYVLTQFHNGCDARGGISKPIAYQYLGDGDYGYAEYTGGTVYCQGDPDHNWYYSGSWGYQGTWGRDYIELEKYPAVDLSGSLGDDLAELWRDLKVVSKHRPVFAPHHLYEHIRDIELPNLARSLEGGPFEQYPVLKEYLGLLRRSSDLDEGGQAIGLYLDTLYNVHTTSRLGVRFYDSETGKGYCPVCGHELAFYPMDC